MIRRSDCALLLVLVCAGCNTDPDTVLDTVCDNSGCISQQKFSDNIHGQPPIAEPPSRDYTTSVKTNVASVSKPPTTTAMPQSLASNKLTLDSKTASSTPTGLFARVVPADGPPQAFTIAPNIALSPDEFLQRYAAELWDLSNEDEIVAVGSPSPGFNGHVNQTYVQRHKGYPVVGGSLVLTTLNGRLVSGGGDLIGGLARNQVANTSQGQPISQGQAKARALDDVAQVLHLTKRPKLLEEPEGKLVVSHGRLAWRFTVVVRNPFAERLVDVDALTGAILMNWDQLLSAWTPQTVTAQGLDLDNDPTTYFATIQMMAEVQTDPVPSGASKTRMQYGSLAVLDATGIPSNVDFISAAQPFTSPDVGFFGPYTEPAVTMMWSMQSAQQYLKDHFQFIGLDGLGGGLNAYINAPVVTPLLTPTYAQKFDVILSPPGTTTLQYDVLGHEVLHAVEAKITGSVGQLPQPTTEQAALWESYSDIFGILLEKKMTLASSIDWTMAKPVIRRIDDPTMSPTGAQSVYYQDAAFQAGDQYTKAGVQSKWFHLLATGGTPPVAGVVGMGIDEAEQIALGTFLKKKPSNYLKAAELSLATAAEKCGEYSQLWLSVANSWHHVGLGPFVDEPFVSPLQDEADVPAWPTTLMWKRYPQEVSWEVQIDTQDTFNSNDLRVSQVPDAANQPPGIVTKEVNLRPATKYFWRVRANLPNQSQLGCWRPVHSFTTADMKPELISPIAGEAAHPWKLTFEWRLPDGAIDSDLSIEADGYDKLEVPVPCGSGVPQCSHEENLPVDWTFHWSAKALGPTDLYSPNEGVPADSGALQTLLPKSSFAGYSGGPWPAKIKWEEVRGAEFYDARILGYGELPLGTDNYVGDPNVEIWSDPAIAATSAEAYLDPNAVWYQLILEPIGPDIILGKNATPERGEQTRDSFKFEDAANADVDIESPLVYWAECREQDTMVHVTWNQIEGAEYYEVSVYEFELPWPEGSFSITDHGPLVSRFTVPHEAGASMGSTDLPAFPMTFSTPLTAGYAITVVGMSPGGKWDSYCGGDGIHGCEHLALNGWLVQPRAPEPIAPLSGTVQEGLHSVLRWKSALANGGSFYLQAHIGSDCSDEDPFADTKETGASAGEWGYGIQWGTPGWPSSDSDLEKSWRVRPTGVYFTCDPSPHWSSCQSIVVNKTCGSAGKDCCEESEACDSASVCVAGTCEKCGVQGSPCCTSGSNSCGPGLQCESGTCTVASQVCNTTAVAGGNAIDSRIWEMGKTSGIVTLKYRTFDVHDRLTVFYEGTKIGDSSCQATGDLIDSISFQYSGSSSKLTVKVEPSCDPSTAVPTTEWEYILSCP